jgi:hypothetical protein
LKVPPVEAVAARGALPPRAVAVEGRENCWARATLADELAETWGTWAAL